MKEREKSARITNNKKSSNFFVPRTTVESKAKTGKFNKEHVLSLGIIDT
jgi:hypothetical protein